MQLIITHREKLYSFEINSKTVNLSVKLKAIELLIKEKDLYFSKCGLAKAYSTHTLKPEDKSIAKDLQKDL